MEPRNEFRKLTLSSIPAGTTIGRNDNECGHMGARIMAGTFGCTIDAPVAAAYAVLPVGVAMISPRQIE